MITCVFVEQYLFAGQLSWGSESINCYNKLKKDLFDVKYFLQFMDPESHQKALQQIRDSMKYYENFPKPNQSFIDVLPIVSDPHKLQFIIQILAKTLQQQQIQYSKIFMLESRGFLFGVPLSLRVKKPCFPFRKKNKLPGEVHSYTYELEYDTDTIEVQKSVISEGDKVIIVDDILATGGTLNAAITLLQNLGASVQKCLVVCKIGALKGDEKLLVCKDKVASIFDM